MGNCRRKSKWVLPVGNISAPRWSRAKNVLRARRKGRISSVTWRQRSPSWKIFFAIGAAANSASLSVRISPTGETSRYEISLISQRPHSLICVRLGVFEFHVHVLMNPEPEIPIWREFYFPTKNIISRQTRCLGLKVFTFFEIPYSSFDI